MKILHIISSLDPKYGGPISALYGLSISQLDAGAQITIVATFKKGEDHELADRLVQKGIVVQLIGPSIGPYRWHRSTRSVLEPLISNSHVVHIHGLWEHILATAGKLAVRKSKPYLVRPCGMLSRWSLCQSRFKKIVMLYLSVKEMLDKADAIHVSSQSERELLVFPKDTKEDKIIVVPNGVDVTPPETNALCENTIRAKYNLPSNAKIVLFLGRLHHLKGLDLLIKAIAEISKKRCEMKDPIVLLVCGPDEDGYLAVIEQLIEQLNVKDRIVVCGPIYGELKYRVLSESDIFCLPSEHENFGIAVIESAAAGLPVVVSKHVGLCQEILERGAGLVVERDVVQITNALELLLHDEALRKATGLRAKTWVFETYTWISIADRWVNFYYPRVYSKIGSLQD